MKKGFTLQIIVLILVYSVMSFAYMHSTFTSKDVLTMIVDRLDRIESKVDIINNNKQHGEK